MGSLTISHGRREASAAGQRLALTPTEFAILMTLASQPGRIFRREELIVTLWGEVGAVQSHTLDVHVARLRRKLVDAGSPIITAVYGIGFRLQERDDA